MPSSINNLVKWKIWSLNKNVLIFKYSQSYVTCVQFLSVNFKLQKIDSSIMQSCKKSLTKWAIRFKSEIWYSIKNWICQTFDHIDFLRSSYQKNLSPFVFISLLFHRQVDDLLRSLKTFQLFCLSVCNSPSLSHTHSLSLSLSLLHTFSKGCRDWKQKLKT